MRANLAQAVRWRRSTKHEARRAWIWRLIRTAQCFYLSPAPSYADELRGIRLLKANLSPEQRQQYEIDRSFFVVGGVTGRQYRITYGTQLNVSVLDNQGKWMNSLCFVPGDRLPVGDIMLAQKLALELFEIEALKVANSA
jgi:hypothetical protein